jgi:hypothetical protein
MNLLPDIMLWSRNERSSEALVPAAPTIVRASFPAVGAFVAYTLKNEGGLAMSGFEDIREHMDVIGADGVHVGTVDKVEGDRIKLTKADSGLGSHEGHHHFISRGLVAGVEGDKVRLSATGANAVTFEEEESE